MPIENLERTVAHPRPRGRIRRRACVWLAVGLVLAAAGCGVEPGRRSPDVGRINPGVLGSDPTDASTTTVVTNPAPPMALEVANGTDTETNRVAVNAIVDLEEWWGEIYPEVYGGPYEPLSGGLVAIDSRTDPRDVPCGLPSIEQMLDNAFYCPPDDAVVWDQERFMPGLAERYGTLTVAVVIAHEWGHVIQERNGFRDASVIVELQADCFAGAWANRIAQGESRRLTLSTDELDLALAGILSLRDAPGGFAEDPYAHGSGFDRVGAFQDGFESGVSRCAEYRNGDPEPFQFPFVQGSVDESRQGDLPLVGEPGQEGIVDLAFPSLEAFWAETYPLLSDGEAWDPIDEQVAFGADAPPDCGGQPVEDYLLFVCIPDRYVAFESEETIPAAYEQNGDFAVAALFATQYGLDAVDQLDSADSPVAATLQGDCLAGAWAQAILPPGTIEDFILVLSPGDLDEAVAVLLSFRSEGDRDRQGPGFDRVRAFREGVLEGAEACLEIDSD